MKYLFFAFMLFSSMFLKAIPKRGLVAWNTQTMLSDTMERNQLLNQCYANGTTDLFIYAAY